MTILSPRRSLALLGSRRTGRLSYLTGRGPVSLVVVYVVDDSGVLLIPLAPFNEARQYAPGRPLTLEVTGRSASTERWVVRASGTADSKLVVSHHQMDVDEDGSTLSDDFLRRQVPDDELACVALRITVISGFREAAAHRVDHLQRVNAS